MFEQGTNANVVYRADDGNSTTGDTYSYGSVGGFERALGSLTTGSLTPNTFGARLQNTTGANVNRLTVTYFGEQWRTGTAGEDSLRFAFSTNATSLATGAWTAVDELSFGALHINAATASALDGDDPANQQLISFQMEGFMLAPGAEMWIRWQDVDVTGSDHGLAIDNLILTPDYVPTPTVTATPASLSGFAHILGTPSAEQMFDVSGFDLSDDITVTAPAEYEVSLTSGGIFTNSVNVPHVAGVVAPTTIYVRLNGSTVASHTGDAMITSTGADDALVALNGVTNPVPVPTIVVSTNMLPAFSQLVGSPSAEQMFTASGTDLNDDIMVDAPADFEISLTSGSGFGASVTLEHTGGVVSTTTIYVRLNAAMVGSSSGDIDLTSPGATTEMVVVSGNTTAPTPVIMVTPTSLSAFSHVVGTPSAEQMLTVSGTNLVDDITVTAPTSFEVSLTSGSGFASSVMLPHVSGMVNPTLVFVRMNASTVGAHSGDVILSSTGATSEMVPVSGNASSGVGIESAGEVEFALYPNPVMDVLNIASGASINHITVYDAAGRVLIEAAHNQEQFAVLNTTVLSSGMYVIHVQTTQGLISSKFVK
jgi:hypothetical protein